jgi:SAM-dependent methyltransferase
MPKRHRHDPRTRRKPTVGADEGAAATYHDRVAGRYDAIYQGAYWEAYEELSWEGLRRHVPSDLAAPIADLGCGTGLYGLRLLKSGYRVTFCDISQGMLDQAERKARELPGEAISRATFIRDDIAELARLERGSFALAIAQGDPICHAGERAPAAFRACARILRPGGVLVASVDNALAGIDHYLADGDVEGLAGFVRDGLTRWVTREAGERFAVRMFRPDELAPLCARAGLGLVDLYGKPVLPLRAHAHLLEDPDRRTALLRLERSLCRDQAMLGRAAHLQLAARRVAGGPET